MPIIKYKVWIFVFVIMTGTLLLSACAQEKSEIDIAYGAHERQKLDVFYEENFVDAPIIVIIHGGSWNSGDKFLMHTSPEELGSNASQYPPEIVENAAWSRELAQYFVELGFVVVTPNHRLVTPDGENAFPAPVNDVGCATAWIKQHAPEYGGDPSQMHIMGYSSGAHIGALLAYNSERDWLEECPIQDEELTFKGFIGLAGIYDFGVTTKLAPICHLLSELLELEGLSMYSCQQDADPAEWAEANPVDQVSADDPPALLVTGNWDCIINPVDPETELCTANTDRFAAALEEHDIPVDVLVLSGGHGPSPIIDTSSIGEAIIEFVESIHQ